LPKGHVEVGESLLAAAIREVKEETGYTVDAPAAPAVISTVILDRYPPTVHKTVAWFLATPRSGSPEARSEKALVTRVAWVAVSEACYMMRRGDEIDALRRCVDLAGAC
jgi:8-oxo-dGTP pyrophosphatase MutT (NUDIX family)